MKPPIQSLAASLVASLAASLAACAAPPEPAAPLAPAIAAAPAITPDLARANGARAGVYTLDRSHASLVFSVNHLGFSDYTGQFTRFDAVLTIDPADPEGGELLASIDPTSLIVPAPPEGFLESLLGPDWLNTEAFPEIEFESTQITLTGPAAADVTGVLSFLGARQEVRFAAVFNGGYAGFPEFDPNSRIGFAAEGSFARSDFGMTYGLPPEGTQMGVGDIVRFRVDAEFTGPPLEADAAPE